MQTCAQNHRTRARRAVSCRPISSLPASSAFAARAAAASGGQQERNSLARRSRRRSSGRERRAKSLAGGAVRLWSAPGPQLGVTTILAEQIELLLHRAIGEREQDR